MSGELIAKTRRRRRRKREGRLVRAMRWVRFKLELWLRNLPPFGHRTRTKRLFFPGCSLPASDPELTAKVHAHLRDKDPEIGIWSACCGRPLRQFVSDEAADPFQGKLRDVVERDGITEIVTACGNCLGELQGLTHELDGVEIRSLYDLLADDEWEVDRNTAWTVHHPCPARRDRSQADAFLRLADSADLSCTNCGDKRHALSCCLVKSPAADKKRARLEGQTLLTYCAHCTRSFQSDVPTRHVLQELFGSEGHWKPVSFWRSFSSYRRLRTLVRPGSARANRPKGMLPPSS